MTHNGITTIPNPLSEPTSDLRRFPDVTTPPSRKGMLEGDLPGYVLYEHDRAADGLPEATVSYVIRDAQGALKFDAAFRLLVDLGKSEAQSVVL